MLRMHTLPNGTTVLLNHTPSARSISCYGYFPYGVATEPIHQLGITHLLEHLMLCGTEAHPSPLELSMAFEEIGAVTDAATSRDRVLLGVQSPLQSFPKAFFLLADVLLRAKFTPQNVENEKNVIQEELEYYTSDPEFYVYNAISETMWGTDSPSGRRIEGRWETLRELTFEDLQTRYETYYVPNRLVLVIAGPLDLVDTESLLDQFAHLYPDREAPEAAAQIQVYQSVPTAQHARYEYDGDITWGGIGFPFDEAPVDRVKLDLLETMLTEGNASLLQQSLREEKGLLYQLFSGSNPSRFPFEYALSFYASPAKFEHTLRVMQDELQKVVDFPERILEVAKARNMASVSFMAERTNHHARFIGRNYVGHGQLRNADEHCAVLAKVTASEMREYVGNLLQPSRMTVVQIGKSQADEKESRGERHAIV